MITLLLGLRTDDTVVYAGGSRGEMEVRERTEVVECPFSTDFYPNLERPENNFESRQTYFSYSLDKAFHSPEFQANFFSREIEWAVFTETAS